MCATPNIQNLDHEQNALKKLESSAFKFWMLGALCGSENSDPLSYQVGIPFLVLFYTCTGEVCVQEYTQSSLRCP